MAITSVTFRDYQLEDANKIRNALDAGEKVMYQLPTGGGKSFVGLYIAGKYIEQGRRIVWLTHRVELQEQVIGHFEKHNFPKDRWRVISPLKLRRSLYDTSDDPFLSDIRKSKALLIIDEGHHSAANTWNDAIVMWRRRGGSILGMTATPWRMSNEEGFPRYTKLITGPTLHDLVQQGYLSNIEYYSTVHIPITGRPTPNTPNTCLLYTSPSPRDRQKSRMPSSA